MSTNLCSLPRPSRNDLLLLTYEKHQKRERRTPLRRKTSMQAQKPSTNTYVLGQAPEAIQRLLKQGQLLNSFTRKLLVEAGITTGMNVLDLGCGPGDVSLLAASLVGNTGRVLGVDTNPAVLQLAQARAEEAGFGQVSFLAGDINNLTLGQEYHAIVGRLVL